MRLDKKIQYVLEEGNVVELDKLYNATELRKFEEALSLACFEYPSILAYTFLCMKLIRQETAKLHYIASVLLIHPLCRLEGGYASAAYHIRRAIELDADNVVLKEALLFLHRVPDRVVGKKEAIETAKQILKKEPENGCAKDILKEYGVDF